LAYDPDINPGFSGEKTLFRMLPSLYATVLILSLISCYHPGVPVVRHWDSSSRFPEASNASRAVIPQGNAALASDDLRSRTYTPSPATNRAGLGVVLRTGVGSARSEDPPPAPRPGVSHPFPSALSGVADSIPLHASTIAGPRLPWHRHSSPWRAHDLTQERAWLAEVSHRGLWDLQPQVALRFPHPLAPCPPPCSETHTVPIISHPPWGLPGGQGITGKGSRRQATVLDGTPGVQPLGG
jgi:hypothetical protein